MDGPVRKRRETDDPDQIGTKGCNVKDFRQKVKDNTYHHTFEGTDLNLERMYVYLCIDTLMFLDLSKVIIIQVLLWPGLVTMAILYWL